MAAKHCKPLYIMMGPWQFAVAIPAAPACNLPTYISEVVRRMWICLPHGVAFQDGYERLDCVDLGLAD